jgi:hypothetical protein
MKKEVTLVLEPFYPKKLEVGMLMAYKKKKLQPDKHNYSPFYLTQDDVDIHIKIQENWIPVKPYLISDDDFESEDLLMFSVNGKLSAAYFDELLGSGINWVKKVVATPEEIGQISTELIKKIIKNGESSGKCEIEMVNKEYNPDHNGECLGCDEISKELCTCKPEPKLLDDKVVIFI